MFWFFVFLISATVGGQKSMTPWSFRLQSHCLTLLGDSRMNPLSSNGFFLYKSKRFALSFKLHNHLPECTIKPWVTFKRNMTIFENTDIYKDLTYKMSLNFLLASSLVSHATCHNCHLSLLSLVTIVTCHYCHLSILSLVTIVTCHYCHLSLLSLVTHSWLSCLP